MDFIVMPQTDALRHYTKCGIIYRSPNIHDKHHLLLSCLQCTEVFSRLDSFLEHSLKHIQLRDVNDRTLEPAVHGNSVKCKKESKLQSQGEIVHDQLLKMEFKDGKDPLEEEDATPVHIKIENVHTAGPQDTNKGSLLKAADSDVEQGIVSGEESGGQCTSAGSLENKKLCSSDESNLFAPQGKCSRMTNICDDLSCEQLLFIIKLLRENECFWNEENIYHTSNSYKQETLKTCSKIFASNFKSTRSNTNEMGNVFEELKQIVVNENKQRLKSLKTDALSDYVPQHKLYQDLQFLSTHVGPFRCGECRHMFMDIYAYKFHVAKHNGTKPFRCMICQKELSYKKGFMCHLQRHTHECPFKCDFCEKSFPSRKEQQRHIVKHGSKPYVCELCAHTFYTRHQLTNHMKKHANIRDHVCPQCGKGFTHQGLLRQHLHTHKKVECVCSLCNNIYANPRSLRKHYVRVHQVATQETSALTSTKSCKICMISFSSILEAKQHRKEHRQSLPIKRKHVCETCGHYFAYPRNLADHKKTHSNVRDQVCDVCGKAFTTENLLKQHKKVHNSEKFICKLCGKDYAHYRGLFRHMTNVHKSCIKEENDKELKGREKTDENASFVNG